MLINVTFDTSVGTAPGAFETDVEAAAAFFDKELTNPITVDIAVGYGEIGGQRVTDGGGESEAPYNSYSYTAARAALASAATSAAAEEAVSTLPASDPTGLGTVYIPQAEADALGLASGVASGSAGFSSTADWNYSLSNLAVPNEIDFIGAVEHEFSEILGRVSGLDERSEHSIMDLFRYSAAGTRSLVAGKAAYFSIDGGTTDLGIFNTVAGGDYGDWASSVTNNSFDAFVTSGTANIVSANDLTLLNALGYSLPGTAVPVITGTTGGQTVLATGSIVPFAGVTIADANTGETEALTVTLSSAANGTLSNLSGGTNSASTGSYTISGSLAVVQAALDALVFTPNAALTPAGGSTTTSFTISVNDTVATTTDTRTSVVATAPAIPVINGSVADQSVLVGGTISPFAGVSITDANAGVSENVTVVLSNPVDGSLAKLGGGSYVAASGTYSVSGTLAAVVAALEGLVFVPSATSAQPGSSATTSFTITIRDGLAAAVSDAHTSVTAIDPATAQSSGLPDVTALLSPAANADLQQALAALSPTNTTANVVTAANGATTVPAVAGVLNALVVSGAASGAIVAPPSGYQAVYLLGAAGSAIDDGNGRTLLVGTAANDTLYGAANDTLIGGNSNDTMVAGGGAETLVGSTGRNLLALGAGTDLVVAQGADTIIGGSGAATITGAASPLYFGGAGATDFIATGGAPTLVGGAAETVDAGSSTPLVFGGAGTLAYAQGSGAGTVVGGAQEAVSLSGGSAPLLFFGNGPARYAPGSAVDTILGGTGSLTATGGASGTLIFGGTSGNNLLATGAGASTIIGGGNGDVLTATGSGADVIGASGGAETINAAASQGSNAFFAGNGADCIVGGAGRTAIVAGASNDTLVAGSGSTLIVIYSGVPGRTDVIAGFNATADFISVPGAASGTITAMLSAATHTGGNTTIALADGSNVTFVGLANLTASSFV